ncbi:hypothetical protein WG66_004356 [Moniliophthora roreri]|nr:hypothetical protein WG66_004356 [Moniliophthora roreri]
MVHADEQCCRNTVMALLTIPIEIRSIIIEKAILSSRPVPGYRKAAITTHQPLQSSNYEQLPLQCLVLRTDACRDPSHHDETGR